MDHPSQRMSFRQVLGVALLCGMLWALFIIGVLFAAGLLQGNEIPLLKTALVSGVLATLLATLICLKHFWNGQY